MASSPSLRNARLPHLPQAQGRDNALDRQIVGQLARATDAPLILGSRHSDLSFGLHFALRLFDIFNGQFELVDKQLAAF